MNKIFLIISLLLLVTLYACTQKKDGTTNTELSQTPLANQETRDTIKYIKEKPIIDTLKAEGKLLKFYNTELDGMIGVSIKTEEKILELNYPVNNKQEYLEGTNELVNRYVQIDYYNKLSFFEFDITIDGATIHAGSEFEPTEDAPFKWNKVDGVLSANTLSNGVPKPITITSKDGSQTIINSYVQQSHLDNNGKEVTAYYGEERQHNAISISVTEQVTNRSPFLGVWGTDSPIIIADGGEDGYYVYFGQDAGFIKADVESDTIEGSNFSGKFTIKLISTNPPQFLYSDDGRGHFEPIKDQLHEKVVSNYAKLLVGKWQSVDDAKSIVEYSDYDLINYYDEKIIDREPYCLSPKCMNYSEVNRAPSSKHEYISVIDSDMCWFIVNLDEYNLTLSYTASGNTLNYKRIN